MSGAPYRAIIILIFIVTLFDLRDRQVYEQKYRRNILSTSGYHGVLSMRWTDTLDPSFRAADYTVSNDKSKLFAVAVVYIPEKYHVPRLHGYN